MKYEIIFPRIVFVHRIVCAFIANADQEENF